MRSSPDNGSSWSAVRTLHDYSAKPKPKPKPNPSPSPSPSPRPSPNQVRTLHNYSGVVSGYVAPTVDHRSGAVLLFFNVNYTQACQYASPSPSPQLHSSLTLSLPLTLTLIRRPGCAAQRTTVPHGRPRSTAPPQWDRSPSALACS